MIAKMLAPTTMTMKVARADDDERQQEDTDIYGDHRHDDHMTSKTMVMVTVCCGSGKDGSDSDCDAARAG